MRVVNWTEAAPADLRAIEAYLTRHSSQYARVLVARVFARTAQLGGMSLLGSEVPEYGDEALRELFEHPYRIVYRIAVVQIDVLAVVHGARAMPPGCRSEVSRYTRHATFMP